ncbi:MAG TPA: ferritin-like domain-containing protein [Verrucomicrobiae bacterium]|nr:ferritin-like domain-containing protein [Verrucomicrobiae bacterium]
MKRWLDYFQYNRDHRFDIPWERSAHPDPCLRGPLIASLQRFQVGESGTGSHLRVKAAATNDPDYQAALDLFIKEEQEHARLMAEVLRRLGAPLLGDHWSDRIFVLLRRLFGLNLELLVLLLPEMIAKRFFRALHDGTHDPVLCAVFAQIVYDEEGHLGFHTDYLQHAFAMLPLWKRGVLRAVWRVAFRVACLVVMFDHRAALRATGVSWAKFWWDCGLIFDEVAARIFSCAPTPVLARPLLQRA